MLGVLVELDQDTAELLTTAAGCGGATYHMPAVCGVCFAREQDPAGLWWCCKRLPSTSSLLTWLHSQSLLALNLFCSLNTRLPCAALVARGAGQSARCGGAGGGIWVHSDPSTMRGEIKLKTCFVGWDIRLELVVWMAAQCLHWVCSPGSQLAHVLPCPKCCFA